jgi:hypothetical protein
VPLFLSDLKFHRSPGRPLIWLFDEVLGLTLPAGGETALALGTADDFSRVDVTARGVTSNGGATPTGIVGLGAGFPGALCSRGAAFAGTSGLAEAFGVTWGSEPAALLSCSDVLAAASLSIVGWLGSASAERPVVEKKTIMPSAAAHAAPTKAKALVA